MEPSVSGLDLSEPDDETLHVMQPSMMEQHLVELLIYKGMPLIGYVLSIKDSL